MNLNKYKHIIFSTMLSSLLLIGLFLLLNGAPQIASAASRELFVTPSGSGNCSQAAPCDLQTALGLANDGDTIYMAAGTYTGTGGAVVTIAKSITLYGGWNGTTTTPPVRNASLYPTILDGEETRRGVYITGPSTVTLEDLTIVNGKIISTTSTGQWNGAGLYAKDVVLTLQHTNFYSNVVNVFDVSGSHSYGSGAFVEGGELNANANTFRGNSTWARTSSSGGGLAVSQSRAVTVTDCLFESNDAWHGSGFSFMGDASNPAPLLLHNNTFIDNGWGKSVGRAYGGYAGAIEITNAQAQIDGNVIQGNRASNNYGAVAVYYSELSLTRNFILDTQCGRISGLYLANVSPFIVTNNIIANNHSQDSWIQSPAVRVTGGSGQFLHNTIARNEGAYGLLLNSNATVAMTNNILVSHTVGISVTSGSTASMNATLWGSGAWANGTDWGGDGSINTGSINIWGDPAFANPDSGDYHISYGSAARDAGVNIGVTLDVDGDSRPQNNGYDIGADEFKWRIYLPWHVKNYH